MSNNVNDLSEVGSRFALVVSRANGFSQSLPTSYRQFLKYIEAAPNITGYVPHSFAWRGRNRPVGFNCKMAFAKVDRDFIPFEPKLLDNAKSILTTPVFGAAKRRTMIWERRILASSAQLVFSSEPPSQKLKKPPWSYFTRNSIAQLKKYSEWEKAVFPSAQLRLMSGMQASARGGVSHDELGKMLNLQSLFSGLAYKAPHSNQRPVSGSRVSSTEIWTACFLIGGQKSRRHNNRWGDEWKAWPVLLPPMPHISTPDQAQATDDNPNLQHGGLFDVGIVVERSEYRLDDDAIARFTRALEHFSVHLAQLQNLRRLVNYWWEPMLNPPSWNDKQIAAGNFLRAWQQHSLHVDSLWALGANDPQADPTIVASLDHAIGLTRSWQQESRRLSDLVRLSSQILGDGDPSIHLNTTGQ